MAMLPGWDPDVYSRQGIPLPGSMVVILPSHPGTVIQVSERPLPYGRGVAEYDPTAGAKFQQAAHVTAGVNTPIDRVVMHGTVSRCFVGGAQATADYFTNPASGGSAHYVVDPATIIQCVAESAIAGTPRRTATPSASS